MRPFGDWCVVHRPCPGPDPDNGQWPRGEHPRPAEAERSEAMRSAMEIDGSGAVIQFDPDMFRALVGRICRRVRRSERRRGLLRAGRRGPRTRGRGVAQGLSGEVRGGRCCGVEPRKRISGKFNGCLPAGVAVRRCGGSGRPVSLPDPSEIETEAGRAGPGLRQCRRGRRAPGRRIR